MTARYELWYTDGLGNRIDIIQGVTELEYVKTIGGVGFARIALMNAQDKTYFNNVPDRRIHIYRQAYGDIQRLELICFARKFSYMTDDTGLIDYVMSGGDANELLTRRIVAYYAEQSESLKTDFADDMMKEVVNENFSSGSTTDYDGNAITTRDMSGNGFSIQADLGAGPSITKAFAWQNMLNVLQKLQAASKTEGTEVFFGIVPTSPTALQFQTWTGQPGADRTSTGTNPIIFSSQWGNLSRPQLDVDFTNEVNQEYGLGQGQTSDRIVQEAADSTAQGKSIWNRREDAAGSNAKTTAGVLASAEDELTRDRAQKKFRGNLLSTDNTQYGTPSGWNLGDKVTVNEYGFQFDTIIRSVHVKLNNDNGEDISTRIEEVI